MIQFVTLTLEIVGLSLAYVELRHRELADYIEQYIDDAEHRLFDYGTKYSKTWQFEVIITVAIALIMVLGIGYLLGHFRDLHVAIWIYFWIVVGGMLSIISLILLAEFISFLNRFSRGSAITSFGVFLAALGVCGEIYQLFL